MPDEYLTRNEHAEFEKRFDSETSRINKRLELLENTIGQLNTLTLSVEKMAISLEHLSAELKNQGSLLKEQSGRLRDLEDEPKTIFKTGRNAVIQSLAAGFAGILITMVVLAVKSKGI